MLRIFNQDHQDEKTVDLKKVHGEIMDSISRERNELEKMGDYLTKINVDIVGARDTLNGLLASIEEVENVKDKVIAEKVALLGEVSALKKEKDNIGIDKELKNKELLLFSEELDKRRKALVDDYKQYLLSIKEEKNTLEQESIAVFESISLADKKLSEMKIEEDTIVSKINEASEKLEKINQEININSDNLKIETTIYRNVLGQSAVANDQLEELKKQEAVVFAEVEKQSSILNIIKQELLSKSNELEKKQEQMLSLVAREQRINDLIPQIKEITEKIGLKINL
jgi:chromosome segregation ATPase